ncbi:hypothetical protein HK102_005185 [Quaeritorhiza haematococci]|nr:hypothetical protein HK102_005185 [Quaeritorhiza haematococci]
MSTSTFSRPFPRFVIAAFLTLLIFSDTFVTSVAAFGQNCLKDNSDQLIQQTQPPTGGPRFRGASSRLRDPHISTITNHAEQQSSSKDGNGEAENDKGDEPLFFEFPESSRIMPANLKVAFMGDQGLGADSRRVLRMIREWGAEGLVLLGDFDYQDDPEAWMNELDENLGDIPAFAVVGNHDLLKWYTPNGYRDRLVARMERLGLNDTCFGEYGVNSLCMWNGMMIVLSGVGTLGSQHDKFIDNMFTTYAPQTPWKICAWHKNQHDYQTGDKEDETGYAVYEVCRKHGAIIASAHEHSYERTHLMSNFERHVVASKKKTLRVQPGKTFAFVSGLGGDSIRPWVGGLEKNPWWAATVSADNGGNYGALLCEFNIKGDPSRSKCKFQDVDGVVWDRFNIQVSSKTVSTGSTHDFDAEEAPDAEPDAEPSPIQSPSREEFIEIPVSSISDIATQHLPTGSITCGPTRMYFSSTSSPSSVTSASSSPHESQHSMFLHGIRFAMGNLRLGPTDRIKKAFLQVMGAHPPTRLSKGTHSIVQTSTTNATVDLHVEIKAAVPKVEAGTTTPVAIFCDPKSGIQAHDAVDALNANGNELFVLQQPRQPSTSSSFSFPPRSANLGQTTLTSLQTTQNSITWDRDSDNWEIGEVWVSPDISEVVTEAIEVSRRDSSFPSEVTLLLQGRTAFPSDEQQGSWMERDRGIYGAIDELGLCLAPTLVLVVERGV